MATPDREEKDSLIAISKQIPSFRREQLRADLDFLKTISTWPTIGEEGLLAFGLTEATPKSLTKWLTDRVSFIVPTILNQSLPIIGSQTLRTYPSTQYIPRNLNHMFLIRDQNRNAMMANIGTGYYLLGKRNSQTVSVRMKEHFPHGDRYMAIMTPRVGLIEAYPSYFNAKKSLSGKGNQPSDRIMRLSFLFHEGRHSDGNGETLGFYHEECPVGHDYAGLFACDTPSNGSYRISALFLKNSLEACHSCSEDHKEALRLAYLDARNRILDRKIMTAEEVDELNALENRLNLLLQEIFSQLKTLNENEKDALISKLEDLESRIYDLKNTDAPTKVYWNAMPEGLQ